MRLLLVLLPLFVGACTRSASTHTAPLKGAALLNAKGCLACHSVTGNPGVGPTFKGLYGKLETLSDGSQVKVDETYLRESITQPGARSVRGYPPSMPAIPLTESELNELVATIKELSK